MRFTLQALRKRVSRRVLQFKVEQRIRIVTATSSDGSARSKESTLEVGQLYDWVIEAVKAARIFNQSAKPDLLAGSGTPTTDSRKTVNHRVAKSN